MSCMCAHCDRILEGHLLQSQGETASDWHVLTFLVVARSGVYSAAQQYNDVRFPGQ